MDATMEIRREHLDDAVRRGTLTPGQADALWRDLEAAAPAPGQPAEPATTSEPEPARRSRLPDAVVIAAALVGAAPAASLLFGAWERSGPAAGFAVAAAFGLACLAGGRLLYRRSQPAAAAVLVLAAVGLAPVATTALVQWLGLPPPPPPDDLGDWLASTAVLPVASAALAAGLALRAFRLAPLAAAPPAIAWFAAMGAAPAVFGPSPAWAQRALLSALVGLVTLGAGFALDGRTRRDHAHWLYLAGLVAFWGGLTTSHAASALSIALYLAVNTWLLAAGLLIGRRPLAVFGAIGLAGGVGNLAVDRLEAFAAPFAFAAIALLLVGGGLLWVRREGVARARLVAALPPPLRRLLPPRGR